MLIPRFTIRTLLLLTTACSFFSLLLTFAARGQAWAMAISIAVGGLVLAFLCYGLFFAGAFLLASLIGAVRPKRKEGDPFADTNLPPQIIPPQEPE